MDKVVGEKKDVTKIGQKNNQEEGVRIALIINQRGINGGPGFHPQASWKALGNLGSVTLSLTYLTGL